MRMDRRLCFSPNSMHIWNKYNITWTNRGSLGDWITAGTYITGLAPEGIYVDGTRISKSTTIYRSDLLSNMPNYNSSYSVSSNGFIELSGDVTSSSEVYTSCNNIIARKIGFSSINYRVFSGGIWYWKKYKGIINGYTAMPSGETGFIATGYSSDMSLLPGYDNRDLVFSGILPDDPIHDQPYTLYCIWLISSDSYTVNSDGTISLDGDCYPYSVTYPGNYPQNKYFIEIDSEHYWYVEDTIAAEAESLGYEAGSDEYNSLYDNYMSEFRTNSYVYEYTGDYSNAYDDETYNIIKPTPIRKKGSYIGLVSSDNQNKYPKDGYTNFDEYYYEFDHYGDAVKGTTYLGQVKDKNENAYPDNGLYNGYWYVKVK